jgi:hypothetical protein
MVARTGWLELQQALWAFDPPWAAAGGVKCAQLVWTWEMFDSSLALH